MRHSRYVLTLLGLLAVLWAALAIDPLYRNDWILENVLLLGAVALLAATYRAFPLSRISYTLIFVFLCLHTIGAHYTYAEVPYDRWFTQAFGASFNELAGWKRNNFDRVWAKQVWKSSLAGRGSECARQALL